MAADLGRFCAGEPISARRPGPASRAARWARRHPGPVYLAAGAVLAAAVVYAVYPPPKVEPVPLPVVQQPPPVEPDEEPRPAKTGAIGKVQAAANRMKTQNNIRQLAIAAHNLHETYGQLPPDAISDAKTGRPLLSWRVAILPFIEQGDLYKQFKLNEPWDSPHNIALLDKMPAKFEVAGTDPPKGHTYFQVFTGPGTLFDPARMRPAGRSARWARP